MLAVSEALLIDILTCAPHRPRKKGTIILIGQVEETEAETLNLCLGHFGNDSDPSL